MSSKPNSQHSILPIALAEGGSTAVSLGALWALERANKLLDPLENYLADTLIYPDMAKRHPPVDDAAKAALLAKAEERASVLIKGTGMITAGFVSHIPLQLALEGKVDGFKMAVLGKAVGVGASLGSIMILNKVTPSFLPSVQKALAPLIRPFIPTSKQEDGKAADEVANLLVLDVASSVVAGLLNYGIARKLR